ncbi:hypothetical protein ARMGADRAFT_539356 [Armillaria gallica]|uniref:Uncharacterized protein n=1 Tax=Armillaria gallica TaxID=47427 RepID=A0A2H3CTA3_ARMGA|nr:hypothetical protein ARMGADRAFT_539356 [Armillaria gallica]
MSQDRKRDRECVTKFALEKEEGYAKEIFVLCRSHLSSSTLLQHWLVSRAGKAPALGYVINIEWTRAIPPRQTHPESHHFRNTQLRILLGAIPSWTSHSCAQK